MARKLRIEYPGALYHVAARGNDRQRIFRTDADRQHLLELLEEGQERYEVRVYAYVLMQTYYHLVAQTEHPNLHSFMHYLNTAYTVWSNKRNRRTGHLFEGPYKAVVMENEGYLLTAAGYVHMNPVRVRGWERRPAEERMERIEQYPWSSYRAYVKAGWPEEGLPQIDCDRVWGELGARNVREGRRQYRKYIRGWLSREEEERKKPSSKQDQTVLNPFCETRLGCFLGSDTFRDFIQGILGKDRKLTDEIVGAKQWRKDVSIEDLLSAICHVFGIDFDNLGRTGRGHRQRDLAMHLCREVGERTLNEVGTAFSVKAAAAGHAINRAKRYLKENPTARRTFSKYRKAVIEELEIQP